MDVRVGQGLVHVQLQGVSPLAFPASIVKELRIPQNNIKGIFIKSHKFTGFGSSGAWPVARRCTCWAKICVGPQQRWH